MVTILAFNPGKAVVQDAVIKITIDTLSHLRTEKTVLPDKQLIIDSLKFFKVILNTLIVKTTANLLLHTEHV